MIFLSASVFWKKRFCQTGEDELMKEEAATPADQLVINGRRLETGWPEQALPNNPETLDPRPSKPWPPMTLEPPFGSAYGETWG
jgi:hypothetical protein